MRKSAGVKVGIILYALTVVCAILLSASVVIAATLSWIGPTVYTDGIAIPAADQARITYTPYTGPAATGPWSARPSTAAGVTSANVPEPAPGSTLYYTVDATLDGMTSAKVSPPVSKTAPYKTPSGCSGLSVQ